jgi:hypothetical protein
MIMKTLVIAASVFSLTLLSFAGAHSIEGYGVKVGGVHGEQNWEYSSQSPFQGIDADPLWGVDASLFIQHSINTTFAYRLSCVMSSEEDPLLRWPP